MTSPTARLVALQPGGKGIPLALAEAATRMNDQSGDAVPDTVWDELVEHCDEQQRLLELERRTLQLAA